MQGTRTYHQRLQVVRNESASLAQTGSNWLGFAETSLPDVLHDPGVNGRKNGIGNNVYFEALQRSIRKVRPEREQLPKPLNAKSVRA